MLLDTTLHCSSFSPHLLRTWFCGSDFVGGLWALGGDEGSIEKQFCAWVVVLRVPALLLALVQPAPAASVV